MFGLTLQGEVLFRRKRAFGCGGHLEHLHDVVAAVLRVTDQPLTMQVHHEVERLKRYLTDPHREIVGDLSHVQSTLPPLDGEAHGKVHWHGRLAAESTRLPRAEMA